MVRDAFAVVASKRVRWTLGVDATDAAAAAARAAQAATWKIEENLEGKISDSSQLHLPEN